MMARKLLVLIKDMMFGCELPAEHVFCDGEEAVEDDRHFTAHRGRYLLQLVQDL